MNDNLESKEKPRLDELRDYKNKPKIPIKP